MSKPRMEPEAVATYGELDDSREAAARQTTNSLKTTQTLLIEGFLMSKPRMEPEAVATYGELGDSREAAARHSTNHLKTTRALLIEGFLMDIL